MGPMTAELCDSDGWAPFRRCEFRTHCGTCTYYIRHAVLASLYPHADLLPIDDRIAPSRMVAHRCRFLPSRWSFPSCSLRGQEAGTSAAPLAMVVVQPARRATVPSRRVEWHRDAAAKRGCCPQVDGIIQSVDFQEGQEVQSGQALFHIDPRPYQNAYAQGSAVLARDSAKWRNAQANAERTKQLLKSKVITQQEGDVKLTTAATARRPSAPIRRTLRRRGSTSITQSFARRSPVRPVVCSSSAAISCVGWRAPLVVINQVRPITVGFSVPSSQLGSSDSTAPRRPAGHGGPGGIAPPTPSIDSLAAEAMAGPSADRNGGRDREWAGRRRCRASRP